MASPRLLPPNVPSRSLASERGFRTRDVPQGHRCWLCHMDVVVLARVRGLKPQSSYH